MTPAAASCIPTSRVLAGLGAGGARRVSALARVPQGPWAPNFQDGEPAPLPVLPAAVEFHCVMVMAPGLDRDALANALWAHGMLVTVFDSLHEAEGLLVGHAVNAVLLDARRGAAAGPQLAWWLNAVGRGQVAVALLGDLAPEDAVQAQQGGVAHCLPWGTSPVAVASLLGHAVGFAPAAWR